jgi:hypothetical protein
MKRLFLAALLLSSATSIAQVTFEHAYISNEQEAQVHFLEGVGSRYMTFNRVTNTINLHDGNHNLWKSIDAKLPAGSVLQYPVFPSTMLFDSDTSVEVLVIYMVTGPGGGLKIQLVDETGTVLNVFNDAERAYVYPFDSSWKLVLHNRNKYGHFWSEVYGLPGKFIAPLKGPKTNTNTNDPSSMLYPNPMNDIATLEYTLPKGEQKGTVQVYSSNGTVIRTYPINQNAGSLIIQRDGLPAGSYYITTTSNGVSGPPIKIAMY